MPRGERLSSLPNKDLEWLHLLIIQWISSPLFLQLRLLMSLSKALLNSSEDRLLCPDHHQESRRYHPCQSGRLSSSRNTFLIVPWALSGCQSNDSLREERTQVSRRRLWWARTARALSFLRSTGLRAFNKCSISSSSEGRHQRPRSRVCIHWLLETQRTTLQVSRDLNTSKFLRLFWKAPK